MLYPRDTRNAGDNLAEHAGNLAPIASSALLYRGGNEFGDVAAANRHALPRDAKQFAVRDCLGCQCLNLSYSRQQWREREAESLGNLAFPVAAGISLAVGAVFAQDQPSVHQHSQMPP